MSKVTFIGPRRNGKPKKASLNYECEYTKTHLFSQDGRVGEKCSTCGRTAQQCCDIGPNQTLIGFRHTSRRHRPIIVRNQFTKIRQSTIETRPPCLIIEAGNVDLGRCHVEAVRGGQEAPLIILGGNGSRIEGGANHLWGGTSIVERPSRLSTERRRDISS